MKANSYPSCFLRMRQMRIRPQLKIVMLLVSSLVCIGCQHLQQQITKPRGEIRQQQYRAALFDPYSVTEVGTDLGGMRPPEFDRPLPEPVRDKYLGQMVRAQQP